MATLNLPLQDIFLGNLFCDRPTKITLDRWLLTKGIRENYFDDSKNDFGDSKSYVCDSQNGFRDRQNGFRNCKNGFRDRQNGFRVSNYGKLIQGNPAVLPKN